MSASWRLPPCFPPLSSPAHSTAGFKANYGSKDLPMTAWKFKGKKPQQREEAEPWLTEDGGAMGGF